MYDLIYKSFSGRTFQQNNAKPHTASVKQHGLSFEEKRPDAEQQFRSFSS